MNPLDYFQVSNIHKGIKATAFGIVLAVLSAVAFFIKQIDWMQLLMGIGISTMFIFAGPSKKKPTNEKPNI